MRETWSQVASDVLAQKYFRKAGVPARLKKVEENAVPSFLWRSVADEAALAELPEGERTGSEISSRQVFDRLAGCWTYWGWKGGYFTSEEDASAFFDELRYMLAMQMVAPNSPQWFNTGLHWAYGIDGPSQGHYYVDYRTGELTKSATAYEHPQPHACFIQSVGDDLVNEGGGMMDLWCAERAVQVRASGTGSNFSRLRGEGEKLSGGGKVRSGPACPFAQDYGRPGGGARIEVGRHHAPRGQDGRRRHLITPDIEKYIDWKVMEEQQESLALVTRLQGCQFQAPQGGAEGLRQLRGRGRRGRRRPAYDPEEEPGPQAGDQGRAARAMVPRQLHQARGSSSRAQGLYDIDFPRLRHGLGFGRPTSPSRAR